MSAFDAMVSALVGVLVTAVPILIARRHRAALSAEGRTTLRYPAPLRWFSAALVAATAASAFAVALGVSTRPAPLRDLAVAVSLNAMAWWMLIETTFLWVECDDRGFIVHSPWHRRRAVAWCDVRSLEWNGMMWWFAICDDRTTVRVPLLLAGVRTVVDAVAQRADAAIGERTRHAIESMKRNGTL